MPGWFTYVIKIDGVLGVILNERWLLTAGHSLHKDGNYRANTNDGDAIDVEEIIPYSACKPKITECKNDVALIKLRRSIKFTKNVRPVCIPTLALQHTFLQNRNESALIFTTLPNGLRKRSVRVNKSKACKYYHFSNHMICAGDLRGVCVGDSGSPLVFSRRIQTQPHNKKSFRHIAYLSGVLSWGNDVVHINDGKVNFGQCDSDPQYMAFTNIAKKLKWIKNKTGVTPRK